MTPGPWKQSGVNPNRIIAAEGRSVGLEICTAKAFRAEYREQSLANARAIAALPDLIEAMLEAIDCGMVPKSSATEGGAVSYSSQVHCADKIRAALTKAGVL